MNESYQVEDGWIETGKGHRFYFNDPQPESIDLQDICWALSKLCRFNGHVKKFYSVAEHSFLIAEYVWKTTRDAQKALMALHHDDGECYFPDIPKPIKVQLVGFKECEAKIDAVIFRKFQLLWETVPPWLKELDSRILVDERQQAMRPSLNDWGVDVLEPLGVKIQFYEPDSIAAIFEWFHAWLKDRI